MHKMYLTFLRTFHQASCHLQGVFSTELQEIFTFAVQLGVKGSRSSQLKNP